MGREEIRRGPGGVLAFGFGRGTGDSTKREAGDIRKWGRPRRHCRALRSVLVEIKLIVARPGGLADSCFR